MQLATIFVHGVWASLLAQSAVDRWRGAQAGAQSDDGSTWMSTALLAALALALLAALVGLVIRRLRRQRQAWAMVRQQAADYGFDDEQTEILTRIARAARIRDPLTIFTVAQAFDRGVKVYVRAPAFTDLSGPDQDWARLQINELRAAMAYPDSDGEAHPDARNTRSLAAGTMLTIFRPDRDELFDAEIVSTNAVDMAVEPKESAYCRAGEVVRVQFSDGQRRYEFETTVVRTRNGRILLDHEDQALPTRSRRHVPIALRRPARIAKLSAHFDTHERMDYFDARLTEVVGPRLTLQSPVQAKVGEQLLVELDLSGSEFIQAPGTIIALPHGQKPGRPVTYVVELADVSEGDLDLIVQSAHDVRDDHPERLERRSRPRRPGEPAPHAEPSEPPDTAPDDRPEPAAQGEPEPVAAGEG